MDHLAVFFGRGLGTLRVERRGRLGRCHGDIGSSLALLQNTGGGAQE